MQQELLIEKVRQYEFLYDVHSVHYRDHNMRQEAWEAIGRDLKIPALKARETWAKLRNCFSNALKRRNKKSGQSAKKKVPWKFENQMSFLLAHIDSRQIHSNLSEEDAEDETVGIELKMDHDLEVEEYLLVPSISTDTSRSRPQLQQTPRRKTFHISPAEEIIDIKRRDSELRMQEVENKIPNNLNETDMFYLSMSKTIQQLPQYDQVHIRMELCRLVSEAEMHQIQAQDTLAPQHTQNLTSTHNQSKSHIHKHTQTHHHTHTQTQTPIAKPNETYSDENDMPTCSASAWR